MHCARCQTTGYNPPLFHTCAHRIANMRAIKIRQRERERGESERACCILIREQQRFKCGCSLGPVCPFCHKPVRFNGHAICLRRQYGVILIEGRHTLFACACLAVSFGGVVAKHVYNDAPINLIILNVYSNIIMGYREY